MDVDQPLVCADLEMLARVLVLERAADDAVDVLLRGERDGSGNGCTGALRGLDDLTRSLLDGRRLVGLEPDSDLVLSEWSHDFAWSLERAKGGPNSGPPSQARCRAESSTPGYRSPPRSPRCGHPR